MARSGNGWLIKGSRCPRCNLEVTYNGNYFCTHCRWVCPENPRGKNKEAFQICYVLLMKQTNREAEINLSILT